MMPAMIPKVLNIRFLSLATFVEASTLAEHPSINAWYSFPSKAMVPIQTGYNIKRYLRFLYHELACTLSLPEVAWFLSLIALISFWSNSLRIFPKDSFKPIAGFTISAPRFHVLSFNCCLFDKDFEVTGLES